MQGLTTERKKEQCVQVTLDELLRLSSCAKPLTLPLFRLKTSSMGLYRSKHIGRGMDFAESRLYQAGDDIRDIDWKVTARSGKAHTKLFQVEKERPVLLFADMRSTMLFATKGVLKSVQAALLSGILGWHAVHEGNRIGGAIITDEETEFFRPSKGKKGIFPFFESLSKKSAFRQVKLRDKTMLDQAISKLDEVTSPGSLIYVISDFRTFSSKSEEIILRASRHSDVCLCHIYDPFEKMLPEYGSYPVTDKLKTWWMTASDKKFREKYTLQFEERRKRLRALGEHRHIKAFEISTEEDCFQVCH